ncbi:ABC transporter ATP-binding protein [Ornithinibacillus contaminans]|uniref:ABC transporter ATP-binding protein n=1 Tax=Ornithinibacillus contaminans TaxID=694055 RepID=UPI00064DC1D2|nr:ABC transporter ATP-binding protein [Ornithinibacillus contaminans]
MLKLQSVTKHYASNTVLSNISFTVNPGEIIGIVGENGAGKSTLLRLLATIDKPTSGKISWNDFSYDTKWKEMRKHIGYVPQEIAIWEDLTVEENMRFFERLTSRHKQIEELRQICLAMNLTKWQETARTLSGGMKRKLNLAITLIHEPEILLLDEPTVGIDLKSKKEIGAYIQKQARDFNRIILYISHDMDEIQALCDRVICIGEDSFYQDILQQTGKEIISF